MGDGVMREFCHREQVGPFGRVSMAKDSKVSLQFLVDAFCFSVSLWMVSGGKGEVVLEESGEFPHEGGCKLRAAIRDKFVVEAESNEDFCYGFSSCLFYSLYIYYAYIS